MSATVPTYSPSIFSRAGNSVIGFLSESLVFAKNEQMNESLKKWAIRSFAHLLILGERPKRFAHNCSFPLSDLSNPHGPSFLVSNLSNSLTSFIKKEGMSKSLIKKEGMSESLIFLIKKKHTKKILDF